MNEPDVTISIVNHANREEVLGCLEDLGLDEGKRRVEIVVLDNDSRDGSVEAIRDRFPHVRVIAQSYTAGFGANHNTIIRSTAARYILVLNDDARVTHASVDELVDYLDEHSRIAALGPKIVRSNGEVHASAWRFPSPAVCAMWACTGGLAGVVQSGGDRPKPVDWVSGSGMMLRRSALETVGLFDERIYMYMEETDLCRRLRSVGFEVYYVPSVEIVHRQWGSTFHIPERRTNELWRSRRYYWRKHHSPVGRLLAHIFDGLRYGMGAVLVACALLIPHRLRPAWADRESLSLYRLNARNALLGPAGDGMWELAIERNSRHLTSSDELAGATPAPPESPLAHRFEPRTRTRGLVKAGLVTGQAAAWTLFHRNGRQSSGLRILYYHRVSDDTDQLTVLPKRFRRQMEAIAASGHDVVDLYSTPLDGNRWTRPALAITFDDGYTDFLDNALPILEEYGFPATVFVIPLAIDGHAMLPWYGPGEQPRLIQWDEMRDVERQRQIRFEPHSLTHPRLPAASHSYAWKEIANSKKAVEEELRREARLFSYPGGYYGAREVELVRQAGYVAAVTCEWGLNSGETNLFELRRTPVDRYDFHRLFRARLAGATDRPPPGVRARCEETSAEPAGPFPAVG